MMGLLQSWPSVEQWSAETQRGTSLGQAVHPQTTLSISGRLRGLCLYLGRVLRPLWLHPIMNVIWAERSAEESRKRRRPDNWLVAEPPPVVKGAQWSCAWTKDQRSYLRGRLFALAVLLDRAKAYLAPGVPDAGLAAQLQSGMLPPAAFANEETIVHGVVELVGAALQGLGFLDLVAARIELLP